MSGQQEVPTNAFAEVVRLMRNDLRPLVEEDTKTKTQEPDVATTEAMLGVRQSALAEDRQDKGTVTSVEASDEMSSRARAEFNKILISGAFTGHAINDYQNLCGAEESYPELLKQYVAKTGIQTRNSGLMTGSAFLQGMGKTGTALTAVLWYAERVAGTANSTAWELERKPTLIICPGGPVVTCESVGRRHPQAISRSILGPDAW
ncbi:hypothetical protein LTR37_003704 [Vermiconidia calcicola]|uniref:Uncharacterized protein n=1 Tax=Vermiconidia calcicola TaxID=1690605 RepID=A0ACC3NS23_9PEZI|nr:hypothetical protein LTR37_003704 [Vermiconidia calcicola]